MFRSWNTTNPCRGAEGQGGSPLLPSSSAPLRGGGVVGRMVVFLPAQVEHETMEAGEEGMRYIVIE